MHEFASYNGQILAAADLRIAALSAATLYGRGVFTTVAIYGGEKEQWHAHRLRISRDAEKLGINISSVDLTGVANSIDELLVRNRVRDGKARVTFFDEGASELWPADLPGQTGVLIVTGERTAPPEYFRLTISPYTINSKSPLAGIKSCNYLEPILAKAEARSRGFDECVQLNERGEITSVAMANIFWQKGATLFTPTLETGCVPGTTRLRVLEGLAEAGFACVEVDAAVDELSSAQVIFLASAGLGLVRVADFEDRLLTSGEFDEPDFGFLRSREHKNTRNRSE